MPTTTTTRSPLSPSLRAHDMANAIVWHTAHAIAQEALDFPPTDYGLCYETDALVQIINRAAYTTALRFAVAQLAAGDDPDAGDAVTATLTAYLAGRIRA